MQDSDAFKQMQDFALHYLPVMKTLGEQIEQCDGQIWQQRPVDGMFAAHTQWRICCNFLLRGVAPFLRMQWPTGFSQFETSDNTWVGLVEQWQKVQDFIEHLANNTDEINLKQHELICVDKAGFSQVELAAPQYVSQYIIPNFCFHLSMLYLVAKQHGVTVSKGHFDGFHQYPTNFSFE